MCISLYICVWALIFRILADCLNGRSSISREEASTAVVISIDDDTLYPEDLVLRLISSLKAVDFRAIVALCGVGVTHLCTQHSVLAID
jgi:hypothetical protein